MAHIMWKSIIQKQSRITKNGILIAKRRKICQLDYLMFLNRSTAKDYRQPSCFIFTKHVAVGQKGKVRQENAVSFQSW